MGNVLAVLVGSDESPADSNDLEAVERMLSNVSGMDIRAVHHDIRFIPLRRPHSTEVLFVKVGSSDRPASSEDIESVEKGLNELMQTNEGGYIVVHHAIEFSYEVLPDSKRRFVVGK